MKVALTGGSGDLGSMVGPSLASLGMTPMNIDLQQAATPYGEFRRGSILDQEFLHESFQGVDAVIHIAAWHGIHEARSEKSRQEFWELNVMGTARVLDAMRERGIRKLVHISTTSVDEPLTPYGRSKLLAEDLVRFYVERGEIDALILRPRAFIPPWNTKVYPTFEAWAQWFAKGAVHITDVRDATILALAYINRTESAALAILTVDGAYEYTEQDFASWDAGGAGSTFRKYFEKYWDVALAAGLDPTKAPKRLDISETTDLLGYRPRYGMRQMLEALTLDGPAEPHCRG
jgi:nucleoside-diphosphate-sugar epimerase